MRSPSVSSWRSTAKPSCAGSSSCSSTTGRSAPSYPSHCSRRPCRRGTRRTNRPLRTSSTPTTRSPASWTRSSRTWCRCHSPAPHRRLRPTAATRRRSTSAQPSRSCGPERCNSTPGGRRPRRRAATVGKVALYVGVPIVLAAGGYSLWAYFTGQAQSEAWKRLGHTIWDQSAKSGEHLVAANPLKGAKLLGAGEAAEEAPKKSLKVQSLLFPKSEFTVAQVPRLGSSPPIQGGEGRGTRRVPPHPAV